MTMLSFAEFAAMKEKSKTEREERKKTKLAEVMSDLQNTVDEKTSISSEKSNEALKRIREEAEEKRLEDEYLNYKAHYNSLEKQKQKEEEERAKALLDAEKEIYKKSGLEESEKREELRKVLQGINGKEQSSSTGSTYEFEYEDLAEKRRRESYRDLLGRIL